MEVRRDVHVEPARQVPRLDDPVVVQPQPLALLEVADELRDLRLEVVRHRQPGGRRRPDVALRLRPPPADDAEEVLDGDDALERELVDPLARVLLAQLPAWCRFI